MSKFAEQMLDATFSFARLALSNAILINGAAATALIAFLANNTTASTGHYNAVLRFAFGAGLGGVACMLAYVGQRCDWERATNPPGSPKLTNALITSALVAGSVSYILFFYGCLAAASSLR